MRDVGGGHDDSGTGCRYGAWGRDDIFLPLARLGSPYRRSWWPHKRQRVSGSDLFYHHLHHWNCAAYNTRQHSSNFTVEHHQYAPAVKWTRGLNRWGGENEHCLEVRSTGTTPKTWRWYLRSPLGTGRGTRVSLGPVGTICCFSTMRLPPAPPPPPPTAAARRHPSPIKR